MVFRNQLCSQFKKKAGVFIIFFSFTVVCRLEADEVLTQIAVKKAKRSRRRKKTWSRELLKAKFDIYIL